MGSIIRRIGPGLSVGGLALDEDLSRAVIRRNPISRVGGSARKIPHDQPWQERKIAQLNDWFRQVKGLGIKYDGTGCDGMRMIIAKIILFGSYYWGYNRTVSCTIVRGNQHDGYRVDGPKYVNN